MNEKIWNGSQCVRLGGHDGDQIIAVAYVNGGETATASRTFKTLAGARKWAARQLSR